MTGKGSKKLKLILSMESLRDEWSQLFFAALPFLGRWWPVCAQEVIARILNFLHRPFRVFIKFLIEFPPRIQRSPTHTTIEQWPEFLERVCVLHTRRATLQSKSKYLSWGIILEASVLSFERNRVFTEDLGGLNEKRMRSQRNIDLLLIDSHFSQNRILISVASTDGGRVAVHKYCRAYCLTRSSESFWTFFNWMRLKCNPEAASISVFGEPCKTADVPLNNFASHQIMSSIWKAFKS